MVIYKTKQISTAISTTL